MLVWIEHLKHFEYMLKVWGDHLSRIENAGLYGNSVLAFEEFSILFASVDVLNNEFSSVLWGGSKNWSLFVVSLATSVS